MKKTILGLAFTLCTVFTLTAKEESSDACFDAAIKSLEQAEAKYGMLSDEQATNYLNHAYGNCVTWMATQ